MRIRSVRLILPLLSILLVFTVSPPPASAAAGDDVDLTHLPLGDSRLSSSPKVGWIWPCRTEPDGGGSFRNGPWFNGDGTYNLKTKLSVGGAVTWTSHDLGITLQGDRRVISTNDLPDHKTGIFPVRSSDPAYQYDRNPNSIKTQKMQIDLPANPTLAPQPSCTPGAIGVMLTGTVLFNALDAPGRDAVAHEVQDACQGHPQVSGTYHYHSLTTCAKDTQDETGHSGLMGYALDGFGIYGRYGENGKRLTSTDLDACHGHTHEITWDGKKVVMYHYHATWDFPYTIGCMRGTVNMAAMMTISGGPQGAGGPNNKGGQNNGGPNLAAAAQKLGITEQQLRDALGPPPPNFAAAARKLGITERQLRDALGIP